MRRGARPPGWWAATVMGALALLLVAADVALSEGNQGRQASVTQRQAFLNETQGLARLNQALVTALAQASVRDNDTDIRALLTSAGITATANPPPAPESPAPAPAPTPEGGGR